MVKVIAFGFLVAVGCGQSECQKYATVYCNRANQCGYNIDGAIVRPAQKECEDGANKQIAAQNMTEDQCVTASKATQALTCTQFQQLAAGGR